MKYKVVVYFDCVDESDLIYLVTDYLVVKNYLVLFVDGVISNIFHLNNIHSYEVVKLC